MVPNARHGPDGGCVVHGIHGPCRAADGAGQGNHTTGVMTCSDESLTVPLLALAQPQGSGTWRKEGTVTTTTDLTIRPFEIHVSDGDLADLRRRIAAMRWPSPELVTDRSQGVQLATLKELARYWAADYDWRRCEAKLNALPMFRTEIDGVEVHFIHVKSPHADAMPLIMTHGWPGSVIEMLGVVGPLTDPTAHGGSAEDAFDLVLPSLPGYGFSAAPAEVGWDPSRVARAWAELMSRLGYARYVAQGGDIGANITDAMGRLAPGGLLGIHLNFLSAFPTDVLAAVFGGSLPGAGLFKRVAVAA